MRQFSQSTVNKSGRVTVQTHMEAKTELARRLLEGDGVDQDEAKAVSLLEDCVVHGDAGAMVMLAKCYALGCGIEQDAEHAETLMTEAAEKGNGEAISFLFLSEYWREQRHIEWYCLCFDRMSHR